MQHTLQEYINNAFETHNNRVAIEQGELKLTYKNLQDMSLAISSKLVHADDELIHSNKPIGICVEDGVIFVAAVLAIIRLGCTFVPLSISYPSNRIAKMMSVAQIDIVFVDEIGLAKTRNIISQESKTVLVVEYNSVDEEITTHKIPSKKYTSNDRIYIYFTSGSSGEPKAIAGKNISLLHFILWEKELLQADHKKRTSLLTSFCHDPVLRDIFLPLLSGGTLCIPKNLMIIRDPIKLSHWLNTCRINFMHVTPSLFRAILNGPVNNFLSLTHVLLAGEELSVQTVERWITRYGDGAQLINLYGPTETTLAKLYHLITHEDVMTGVVPIGKPIRGARVLLLNESGLPCSTNEIGEIYIRTPYLSLGYLNEQAASENFIINPFSQKSDDVIYRTGDMGKIREDGCILFCGRKDRQVKIRGYRVELQEVEAEVSGLDEIQDAVVVAHKSENDDITLCAYYVSDIALDKETFISRLSGTMLDYMIPSFYVQIDGIPLTQNNKIDYESLPKPKIKQLEYVEAEDDIERCVSKIMCDILSIENISVTDNMLHNGGHSLSIMNLVSLIYMEFQVEIPLGIVLENPTVRSVSDYIKNQNISEVQWNSAPLKEYQDIAPEILIKHSNYTISGVEPFTDIIYKGCFYNSLFPAIRCLKGQTNPFFSNDIFIYRLEEGIFTVEHKTVREETSLLNEQGIQEIKLPECKNLVQMLEESIRGNAPVIVNIDCFYHPMRTDTYKKNHWPHFILVYGYDSRTQQFTILDHDDANSTNFCERKISYESLVDCYQGYLTGFPQKKDSSSFYSYMRISDSKIEQKDYYPVLVENYTRYHDDVHQGIDMLQNYVDELSRIIQNASALEQNKTLLNLSLKKIVQAKSSERYRIHRLIGPSWPHCIIDEIVKEWTRMHFALKKQEQLESFDRKNTVSFKEKLQNIVAKERKLLSCLRGN